MKYFWVDKGRPIVLPDTEVILKLVKTTPSRAEIGIDAPRDIRVVRGEKHDPNPVEPDDGPTL